jgi:uncharacterized integral membrane protein
MNRFRQVVLVILIVLVVIVMVQNARPVMFRFLNWQYEVSQLLLVLIALAIGFLAGFGTAKWPRKRREDDLAPPRRG